MDDDDVRTFREVIEAVHNRQAEIGSDRSGAIALSMMTGVEIGEWFLPRAWIVCRSNQPLITWTNQSCFWVHRISLARNEVEQQGPV